MINVVWTHLTLHLDTLLEYLMVFVLLIFQTRLWLWFLLDLDLLLMRLLILRLLTLLLLLRDRLRWLIGVAWRHVTTVTAIVVRLLLRLRYRLAQFFLLLFRHDALQARHRRHLRYVERFHLLLGRKITRLLVYYRFTVRNVGHQVGWLTVVLVHTEMRRQMRWRRGLVVLFLTLLGLVHWFGLEHRRRVIRYVRIGRALYVVAR